MGKNNKKKPRFKKEPKKKGSSDNFYGYDYGSGHVDYSGFGYHKDKRSKRNKRDYQDNYDDLS